MGDDQIINVPETKLRFAKVFVGEEVSHRPCLTRQGGKYSFPVSLATATSHTLLLLIIALRGHRHETKIRPTSRIIALSL